MPTAQMCVLTIQNTELLDTGKWVCQITSQITKKEENEYYMDNEYPQNCTGAISLIENA